MKNCLSKAFVALLLTASFAYATPGVSQAQASGVSVLSDGTILIGGLVTLNNVTQFMTAHFSSLGTVDGTYGTNGYFAVPIGLSSSQINGMVALTNNEAVVAGYAEPAEGTSFAIAQVATNGVLDAAFNSEGSLPGTNTTLVGAGCSGNAIAVDSSGNYIVTGVAVVSGTPLVALIRYTSEGILDDSFGSGGIVTTQIGDRANGYAIAIQSDGHIIIGGYAIISGVSNFALARYNTDGSLDTSFNSSGDLPGTTTTSVGANSVAYGIAIQSDGKIIAVGTADNAFALARFTTDGLLDTTFNSEGSFPGTVETAIGSSDQINAVAIQSNGVIVAVGYSDNILAVACYNSDGSLDTSFNSNGALPGTVTTLIGEVSQALALCIQSNGQILVAGASDANAFLTRYNTDGLVDTLFGASGSGYVSFPNTSQSPNIFGLADINIADDAGIQYKKLDLTNSILNTDINSAAGIEDTKLATIETSGKILNSATTATSLNVTGAIAARDALGNFSAGTISASFVGSVNGSASNNVLKAGDTMTGSLVLPAGSVSNPSLQFSGSTNSGLSVNSNTVTLSTSGNGALSINGNGAVTIAAPGSSQVGLTINGGGATITGDVSGTENLTFNTSGTSLYAVGSTQGPLLKIFWGTGNSGLLGSTTVNYSAAGFTNPPQIYLTSVNGAINALGVNAITSSNASVLSALNVPFNYLAIGV